jgi:hypothetical protein
MHTLSVVHCKSVKFCILLNEILPFSFISWLAIHYLATTEQRKRESLRISRSSEEIAALLVRNQNFSLHFLNWSCLYIQGSEFCYIERQRHSDFQLFLTIRSILSFK